MRLRHCQYIIDLLRGKFSIKDFIRSLFIKSKYDIIMSLGYNCEVTQRIMQLFAGNYEHYLYSWALVKDRTLFLDSLKNLPELRGEYSMLPSGMFLNEDYQIAFHSKFEKQNLIASKDTNPELISSAIKEIKSRLSYLAQKTEKVFTKNKKTLFIIKLDYTDFEADKNYIETLVEVINSKYSVKNNFTLLVVISRQDFLEKTDAFCDLKIPNVNIAPVNCFMSGEAIFTSGDIENWLNVIKTTCQG